MKDMIYNINKEREILDTGRYKGFNYYIINLGTHPVAYIEIPKGHKLYGKGYEEIDLNVHGGLTYADKYLWITESSKKEGWFIGWDYAHCGDYTGYEEMYPKKYRTGGKKWTTEEILEEVKEGIDEI